MGERPVFLDEDLQLLQCGGESRGPVGCLPTAPEHPLTESTDGDGVGGGVTVVLALVAHVEAGAVRLARLDHGGDARALIAESTAQLEHRALETPPDLQ